MKYENIAIPFKIIGNRQVLTGEQIANDKSLKDFVDKFSHCFEPLPNYDALAFYPEGISNKFEPLK